MSLSKILDKDESDDYQRWELPTMPATHSASGWSSKDDELDDVPRFPTAEELAKIQETAYNEGFELGRKEGLQAGEKDIYAEIQRFGQIMAAIAEPLNAVDEEVEQELVNLSIAVARQLIRRELKTDPGQVVAVVREALEILPSHSRYIKIALHPEDAQLVREVFPLNEETPWQIIEDAVLTRGGCRIEAEHSVVDASVEKRLSAIVAELLGGERESDDSHSDQ